jgi:hypothetical protein
MLKVKNQVLNIPSDVEKLVAFKTTCRLPRKTNIPKTRKNTPWPNNHHLCFNTHVCHWLDVGATGFASAPPVKSAIQNPRPLTSDLPYSPFATIR